MSYDIQFHLFIFPELNMYINCKLVGTTQNDDQCLNCHTSGCHTTDTNTKLMLGRANGDPQSNFARFKASDLSIYETYLQPQDIDKICGFSKRKYVYTVLTRVHLFIVFALVHFVL